jgi:hypothetical protein
MDMKDVEIFKTGTWNGDTFTSQDIDDIIASFDKVGYKPPIKLGHGEDDSQPAYGWVTALKRAGNTLLADFADIPDQIAQLIREHRYDAVSAEIFFNLKRGGQLFRRALKAVSLLGAAIPGVAGLKPLRESFQGLAATDYERVTSFDLNQETDEMKTIEQLQADMAALQTQMTEAKGDPTKIAALSTQLSEVTTQITTLAALTAASSTALKAEIAALTAKQHKTDVKSKADACKIPALRPLVAALYAATLDKGTKVMRFSAANKKDEEVEASAVVDEIVAYANSQAAKLFKEIGESGAGQRAEGDPDPLDTSDPQAVANAVDAKVKEFRAKNEKVNYTQALAAVLAADKELATAYHGARH